MRWYISTAVLILSSVASAQVTGPPVATPQLRSIFPAGAQVGTMVEVTLTGVDFDDPKELWFTHPGFSAKFVPAEEPKPDPKAKPGMGKKFVPATAVKFKLSVAKDVPPGTYDVRFRGKHGISNARLFTVGSEPEVNESDNNDDAVLPEESTTGPKAQRITIGTTVNGFFASGTDVDYTAFAGKAGQRVWASCRTSSIDSRARPLVEIYDTQGKRLALNRGYAGNDALADVTLPADGDYYVRLCEFAYLLGNSDYYYRLTVSTGPWVDAIVPVVLAPGKPTKVTVYGRNLPGGVLAPDVMLDGKPLQQVTTTITAPTAIKAHHGAPPALALHEHFSYRFPNANAMPLELNTWPVIVESQQDNDTEATAQKLETPVNLVGRLERKFDKDIYRFSAKKGVKYMIDLAAASLGSDADVTFRIMDEKGQNLSGTLDDELETLHPIAFTTRTSDPPSYTFTAPQDGTFTIHITSIDANVNFGPRCFYRLRIAPPMPGRIVIAMPRSKEYAQAANVPQGGSAAFDVFVSRQDGDMSTVTITAEKLPAGVTAKPITVGPSATWGTLVVTATADAKESISAIDIVALSDEKDARPQRALPASVVWGLPAQNNNTPTVSRLDQQLVLAVVPQKSQYQIELETSKLSVQTKDNQDTKFHKNSSDRPVVLRPGDKFSVPAKLTWTMSDKRTNPINLYMEATQPNNNNAGIVFNNNNNNNNPLLIPNDKSEALANFEVRLGTLPGHYPLVMRAETQLSLELDPTQKGKKTLLTSSTFAAPLNVFVLPASLGKINTNKADTVKRGGEVKVTVTFDRRYAITVPTVVSVAFPKESGLTATDVTVPPAVDEVTLDVRATDDAKTGNTSGTITATATYFDTHAVTSDGKFTVTITK